MLCAQAPEPEHPPRRFFTAPSKDTEREWSIQDEGDYSHLVWKSGENEFGHLKFRKDGSSPFIVSVGFSNSRKDAETPLARDLEPVFSLSVGTRLTPLGRPPDMSAWNVFFDKVHTRPFETHRSKRDLGIPKCDVLGDIPVVRVPGLSLGPFQGELIMSCYPGSRLIRIEAEVSTEMDRRAIIYDAGLVSKASFWEKLSWMDTEGRLQSAPVGEDAPDTPLAVRHRTIIAEGPKGSLACFPPPHQFFFPRDSTDNLKYVWYGKGHGDASVPFGFGVRQSPSGGGAFIPWFNAPPGTRQRLAFFLLPSSGKAEDAMKEVLRYTRNDRFTPLPGHITYTSHYHLAHTVDAMKWREEKVNPLPVPDFVPVFKDLGVQAVHLAEFHGDGHQQDPGPLRFPEMQTMFDECKRLSDEKLLLIPGEEVSGFLGIKEEGKHPGHWMLMFPKPVIWTQRREPDQPFEDHVEPFGKVYRVAGREDMFELLKREGGLGWTAHPRIKASSWTPDIYRNEDFYLSDHWLGGAWKAMPADLSRERLGERCLDLLDDMANWGQRKYLPGEVDVFKINHTHELFGHMNINYLRLSKVPRYEDGWLPIMEALKKGAFFTTTGEILLKEFTVGGCKSGEVCVMNDKAGPEVVVVVEGTFPLAFAELISGDGSKVYRDRMDLLPLCKPFADAKIGWPAKLKGRKWVRVEVWDVAGNGAYSQPVWLE